MLIAFHLEIYHMVQHLNVFKSIILSHLLLLAGCAQTQPLPRNIYGLQTVADMTTYRKLVKRNPMQQLVNLANFIPMLTLDIRYATTNNFLGEPVYPSAKAYLNLAAARALKEVQEDLHHKGLGLKIFDAYRPYQVTVLFYEKVKDTVYVASPYRGSRHNRGAAVDLTLIDLSSGEELQMPTPFDDFSKKAHTNYSELPPGVIRNRELLKSVMVKHGFEVYPDEWWHYDYKGWKGHPLYDLSFEQVELIKNK